MDDQVKYNPEIQRVPGILSMCGPKYAGVNDQCKYNPQTERVESVALMNGPVFKAGPLHLPHLICIPNDCSPPP